MPFHVKGISEFSTTLITHVLVVIMNFCFMINNISFGIRCVIAEVTFEIFFSLVHMSSLKMKDEIIFKSILTGNFF